MDKPSGETCGNQLTRASSVSWRMSPPLRSMEKIWAWPGSDAPCSELNRIRVPSGVYSAAVAGTVKIGQPPVGPPDAGMVKMLDRRAAPSPSSAT